jgi:hypothetical protein
MNRNRERSGMRETWWWSEAMQMTTPAMMGLRSSPRLLSHQQGTLSP